MQSPRALSSLSRYYAVKYLFMMQAKKILFFSPTHYQSFCENHAREDMLRHKRLRQKCRTSCRNVLHHCFDIDQIIASHSEHWSLQRIHAMDLSILRLSTYELRYSKTSVAIIINEAIQLSKEFGEHQSRQFINGLLDAIAHGA
ncbi:MAG: transcription antitermination factor NusB [Proteobacteria bacterium]|nr:transcription antitermination factor NusB [Pseudomonadota bacterium]